MDHKTPGLRLWIPRILIGLACLGGLVIGVGLWLDHETLEGVGGVILVVCLFWQAGRNPEMDPLDDIDLPGISGGDSD